MSFGNIIHIIAVIILPLIFAITLHEAAHGWVANKFGDKTALMMGRVTLNPIKHIDLFGTVILPIVMLVLSKFTFAFGWAKPVPVNWQNLKNPRRDMALVAIAGPLANLLMALIWAAIAKISLVFGESASGSVGKDVATFFFTAGLFGININVILLVLNLIPIPPLDGSRIISSLLPPNLARTYGKIEPYGIWILLALIVFGLLGRALYPPVFYLARLIKGLFGL
jgi:Zn-dependent protease